ncbi:MAG: cytidyltransferase [Flavobacteriales bacterium]|nr:cytidyltransferase [Flavobacteriales bacterium]
MKKKAVIVSGYFNPIHKGHIEYFETAKKHGDLLFVIVNSDYQRQLKNSKEFQDENERLLIVSHLKLVNKAILAVDRDRTVIETIKKIHAEFSQTYNLFFANGGDQNNNTIPEREVCEKLEIKLIDGLGAKIQSSSWLLKAKN